MNLNLNRNMLLNQEVERQSTCELELDVKAEHIQNPKLNKGNYQPELK